MRMRYTSPLVVSALVALCVILSVSSQGRLAATRPGGDAKTKTPATVANGTAAEPNLANPKMLRTDALMHLLDQEISTKDLPRSFWALLDDLTAKMQKTGKELSFFVNVREFSKDVQAVIDGELPPSVFKLQPLPARMSVRAILQMAVNQFDGAEATFVIRQGRVEIMTRQAAALENLLKQTFAASFDQQPLELVLDDLSEITGVSVIIDGRAREKKRTPVTARFRNDVPLREALHMVTESAGLKLVELPGGPYPVRALFVTTSEHAQSLKR